MSHHRLCTDLGLVPAEQKLLNNYIASGKIRLAYEASATEVTIIERKITPRASHRTYPVPKGRDGWLWRHIVCLGSSKSQEDLDVIRAGELPTQDDDVYTARKMGNLALSYCLVETCFWAVVGVGWNFDDALYGVTAVYLLLCYIFYRPLLVAKGIVDKVYFISDEVRITRFQKRPESQLGILHQSNQSLDISAEPSNVNVRTTSPLPSRPVSVTEQRSTAREGQVEFGPQGRIDTEANIGLLP